MEQVAILYSLALLSIKPESNISEKKSVYFALPHNGFGLSGIDKI